LLLRNLRGCFKNQPSTITPRPYFCESWVLALRCVPQRKLCLMGLGTAGHCTGRAGRSLKRRLPRWTALQVHMMPKRITGWSSPRSTDFTGPVISVPDGDTLEVLCTTIAPNACASRSPNATQKNGETRSIVTMGRRTFWVAIIYHMENTKSDPPALRKCRLICPYQRQFPR